MTATKPNPYLEYNLSLDYDLLDSFHCPCGEKKELGAKMCAACYRRLTTGEQVQLAGMRPGDGLASCVLMLTRK